MLPSTLASNLSLRRTSTSEKETARKLPVQLYISTDKPKYQQGEEVTGFVELEILPHSEQLVRSVSVRFFAKEEIQIASDHSEDFHMNTRPNILWDDSESISSLGCGSHKWPFRFELPLSATPSYFCKPDIYGEIYAKMVYGIMACVDIEGYNYEVFSEVTLSSPKERKSDWQNTSSQGSTSKRWLLGGPGFMHLDIKVSPVILAPGDKIHVEMDLENHTLKSIRSAKVKLLEHIYMQGNETEHKDIVSHLKVIDSDHVQAEGCSEEHFSFDVTLPANLQPELKTERFSRKYVLQVYPDVAYANNPFIDFDITLVDCDIPISATSRPF